MKNKTAGLLMEMGVEYDQRRLHGKMYIHDLLERLEEVPESARLWFSLTHSKLEIFEVYQRSTSLVDCRYLTEATSLNMVFRPVRFNPVHSHKEVDKFVRQLDNAFLKMTLA